MSELPSSLRLNNILLRASTSYFIFSSIDGHLGCFHLLAIVKNAAMNMGDKYLFEFLLSILLGIYPEVELLDHMVILFLILFCFPFVCFSFLLQKGGSREMKYQFSPGKMRFKDHPDDDV